ncbi:hypothetical protein LDENG_00075340 [Lucifuga dentata]|nr:hypothetical protein LDENG_00075340 [Lucifuga dentata]
MWQRERERENGGGGGGEGQETLARTNTPWTRSCFQSNRSELNDAASLRPPLELSGHVQHEFNSSAEPFILHPSLPGSVICGSFSKLLNKNSAGLLHTSTGCPSPNR